MRALERQGRMVQLLQLPPLGLDGSPSATRSSPASCSEGRELNSCSWADCRHVGPVLVILPSDSASSSSAMNAAASSRENFPAA